MKQLPSKTTGPPGMWRYIIPKYEIRVKAFSWDQLLHKIQKVYQANGDIPPANLAEEVEAWLCRELGDYCLEVEDGVVKPDLFTEEGRAGASLHIREVWAGMRFFVRWTLAGKPLVTAEEADRRAVICAQCPMNRPHKPCLVCASVYKTVKKMTPERVSAMEHGHLLKVCLVCKCSNAVAVNVPLALMDIPLSTELPGTCWKLEANQ